MCIYIYIYIYIYASLSLSIYLYIDLSLSFSLSLSIYIYIYMQIMHNAYATCSPAMRSPRRTPAQVHAALIETHLWLFIQIKDFFL